jgi:uncharacterized protein
LIKRSSHFDGVNLTINTTEQCNLCCKYCYEINKKSRNIDFENIKKFIDIVLTSNFVDDLAKGRGYIIDFIGGDALDDPILLDKSLTYFSFKLKIFDKPDRFHWYASISTNGTYFNDPKVRNILEKWKRNLSVSVSIDGDPYLHDLNRINKYGMGSIAKILEWWPWYRNIYPEQSLITKATLSKTSIPFMYDSLKFMHEELGITQIDQNYVMEDSGLEEKDYKLFEEQMKLCCDYVLEHKDDLYWGMISDQFLSPSNTLTDKTNKCGSGKMPTLGIDGEIYPCFRWLPISLKPGIKSISAGNVNDINNLDFDKLLEVYDKASRSSCTLDEKCKTCEYESACSYCIAGCYNEFGEFRRTTHICEITKLQCKWSKYYWEKYNESI